MVLQVVEKVRELQALADAERVVGRRIALVPTMGALHAGHLSLVEAARQRANRVWVSIFVNPTQFNDPADLAHYPRTLAADLDACEAVGVDLVFAPTRDEIYPPGSETTVEVPALAAPLCGRVRPGHFRGVASVVARLLNAAKPHVAVFGEKDYQQLLVIRRLVRDLHLEVEIVGAPIVREPDGLALSSRNANLDAEARQQATVLVRALDAAQRAVAEGELDADRLLAQVRAEIAKAPRARIEYAELCDPEDLSPAPPRLEGKTLLALAVAIEPVEADVAPVRLIDNRVIGPQGPWEQPPQ